MTIFCSAVESPCRSCPCRRKAGPQYSVLAAFGVGAVDQSKIFLSVFADPETLFQPHAGTQKEIDDITDFLGRSSVFILAMVLNGPGFIDQRLCLYPDFLRNISTEKLFREGVTRKDLN